MKVKYAGMGLLAVVLVAAGWFLGRPPLAQRAEGQVREKIEKTKAGRYQVISAGLLTAVLMDNETGKTWALTPSTMLDGPRGMGGPDPEFAWAPITKFDDMESYRRWAKQQSENRMKWERERFDRDFRKDDKRDFRKDRKEDFRKDEKKFDDRKRDEKKDDRKFDEKKDDRKLDEKKSL